MLAAENVDLVWAPSQAAMYPTGFATRIVPEGAAKAGLEDKIRPHFFGGVTTVVAKLFTQVQPDFAMFGEKDYQQLRVVTQMAKDLDLGVKVIGVPTVRESGRPRAIVAQRLPLAGRARRRRRRFTACSRRSAADIKRGEPIAKRARRRARRDRACRFCARLSRGAPRAYAGAGHVASHDGPIRLLVAAKIGKTRLIDNIRV